MTRRQEGRSPVIDLLLHVAEALGYGSDRDVAQLADSRGVQRAVNLLVQKR